MQIFLVVLTVAFFGLTVYAVLQENLVLLHVRHTQFFAFKILGIESSASLFVTLLGALLVRNQFVLGLRPRISYKSSKVFKEAAHGKIWQVRLYNSGLGGAIINSCEFELEIPDKDNSGLSLGFDGIVAHLEALGLAIEEDFWMENISSGFTLPPKEDYVVFEIKANHIDTIKSLNMVLYFQGFLGDKYHRNIVLIPKVLAKTHTENL